MADGERFVDNGDGTVTDTKYNKMWMKEDSFLMRGKWLTWKASHKFVAWLNEQKFAGYDDWRVPKTRNAGICTIMNAKIPTSTEISSTSTIYFLKGAGPPIGAPRNRE